MSHIVTVRTKVTSEHALREACRRLSLPPPRHGEFQLFDGVVTGWGVELPKWRYPAVFDLATGAVKFDDFGGQWGEQCELDRLMQSYAVSAATLEARRQGYSVTESTLSDGSIRLLVQVEG